MARTKLNLSLLLCAGLGVFATATAGLIEVPTHQKEIFKALRLAQIGDTVFVRSGTYHENLVLPDGVVLRGEDMVKTIINGNRRGPVIIAGNNSVIENLSICNGLVGVLCKNAAATIQRNLILDNKGTGIHALIALPQIKNNIIMRNKWTGIFCEAAKSLNTAIENNVILENGYAGIHLANNTQVLVRNNILYDNGEYGIYCDKQAKPSRIIYNNIYKNWFAFNRYCVVDKSNISKDPIYLNAGYPHFNYYVKSISPCKSRGENGVDIGLMTEEASVAMSRDQDNDGILDDRDGCPTVPEDIDGFEDTDGCPDYDNDRDGIFDTQDRCPMEPEDRDGFEDQDGCPDNDNDKDGIPDSRDKCPTFAENFNGFKDEDGCPDEKPQIIEKKMTLRGVNFKTASAELTEESYAILDKVFESLDAFPQVRIEISGHTDFQGTAEYNRQLSHDRANSVRNYLISRGTSPSRLVAMGYGEDRPIASNRTASGRAENRRVEITPIK